METVLEIGARGRAILSASLAIGEQSLNGLDERTCSATMPRSFESVLIAFARLAMGNRTSRSPEGCHEGHSGGPRFTACSMACVFKHYDCFAPDSIEFEISVRDARLESLRLPMSTVLIDRSA